MTLAERLRATLSAEPAEPPLTGDLAEQELGPSTAAAVLVAVTDREEPGILLTVRREDMRTHAGQIAFPGGRIDPGEGVVAAALREAHEELGIDPAGADVIGTTDEYRTVTGYVVTPVLAVIPPDLALRPHDREVAAWFEAPMAHLLDAANHRRESAVFRGATRDYYVVDWQGRRIWGATAAMLVNLSRRLQWR
ncbi:CoA pyrophosphatase [Sphingomonas sinipercae]|uniref:CoA pyrophosphatase n=1 Tax=Sphingomonas sinipercae TaxID=2714944 RepID=A0A6G7ZMW3_9SPHN|nr:CoA pyrophosphatase [Sphingomonas sinipercae]QIL02324.1 CoA pyrophosphatase [Sphingomonas sinipercae]